MKLTGITDIQPGSRLGRAVYNAEGKLLFPAGETLTRKILAELKAWGVAAVWPAPPAEERPQPDYAGVVLPEDMMEAVRELVRGRFAEQDLKKPHIAALFDLAVELQGRISLSKPGKVVPSAKPSPAFHTGKPEPVALESLIAESAKMGTLPIIFHRLVEIINSPFASSADAAKIIATDPALSAKLLRLVNSPFYGLGTRIDTISRAVVLVGTGQLVMLAMGATLITSFKGMPVSLVSMQSFWNHSIACGVAARLLARRLGLPQPETWFVAGLLHDIGRLLIFSRLSTHALYLLTEARRRNVSVLGLEPGTLGFTHQEVGAALLRNWRCPDELAVRVGGHHAELAETAEAEKILLPVANLISQGLGYGSSGELRLHPLPASVWDTLRVAPEHLIEMCRQMDEDVREMRSLLSTGE